MLRTFARWSLAAGAAILTFELLLAPIYTLHMVRDPDFGAILRPGTTVRWGFEGWGTSRWGPRGVRGDGARPDGPEPILVLGDSQTEALMVDDDVVFTADLERRLAKSGAARPVINAGKSSHSIADYVALAPRYLATFHPRWTVIQVRDSDFTSDAFAPIKRHFVRTPAGTLDVVDVPDAPRQGARRLLWEARQRSSFLGYAAVRAGRFREAMAKDAPLFHAGAAGDAAPAAPPIERAADWPIDAELTALSAAWGGRITLLYLPELEPHDPAHVSEVGRWLAARCAATGTSFVTLASTFPGLIARGHSPYGFSNTRFNEGHLNAEGHAAAAALLAQELERLGLR